MIHVIYNAQACGGRVRRRKQAIAQAFQERLPDHIWHETQTVEEAIAIACGAAMGDVVVAVGGDGSVHTVAAGLAEGGFQATLGIVPVGTGNDFAFGMGVPAGVPDAVDLIARGGWKMVDVGRASLDGGAAIPFVNALGVGFDAAASLKSRERRFLPGVLRYLVSSLETLATWQPPRACVSGDATFDDQLMFATFGNAPRSGGGFFITPEADPTDGLLDLCAVCALPAVRALGVIPSVMKGTHGSVPEVTMARGSAFAMTVALPVPVHADGEIVSRACTTLDVSVAPGVLRVATSR